MLVTAGLSSAPTSLLAGSAGPTGALTTALTPRSHRLGILRS